jgi:L-alanine-DL-glutamate epimerase-like enolase superfamily enzyme
MSPLAAAAAAAAAAVAEFEEPAPADGKNVFDHFFAPPIDGGASDASALRRRRYTRKQIIHVVDVAMAPLVGTSGGLRLNGAADTHSRPFVPKP